MIDSQNSVQITTQNLIEVQNEMTKCLNIIDKKEIWENNFVIMICTGFVIVGISGIFLCFAFFFPNYDTKAKKIPNLYVIYSLSFFSIIIFIFGICTFVFIAIHHMNRSEEIAQACDNFNKAIKNI